MTHLEKILSGFKYLLSLINVVLTFLIRIKYNWYLQMMS